MQYVTTYKHELFQHIYGFYFMYSINFFPMHFNYFLLWKTCLIFVCHCLLYRRGNDHFDVLFRRIGPVLFPSKDGKVAVREARNGRKVVYLPPESSSFPLINNMIQVLFPIFTLIWRVNNHVSRQGKV